MLTNPSSGRRTTGRLIVLASVAIALPLTATRAIEYVDVPVRAKAAVNTLQAAVAPVTPAAPAAPVAAAAPVASVHPAKSMHIDGEGTIHINGTSKKWRDLTPEEKAEVRRSIAHAKKELARTRIDREEINRQIREAMAEAKIDKEELSRDLQEARAEIERAMRDVDAHVLDIRRSGQNPDQIKATIRASLKAVEAIDVEAIHRRAMASVDHKAIAASVAAAEASVARAQAEVERVEEQFEDDE